MKIICHNRFGTYQGSNAGEVLRAIHAEAALSTPISFEEWKSYNAELWKAGYNIDVPQGGDPGSEEGFLKILLDVGAVEPGPKPPEKPAGLNGGAREG